MRRFALAVMGSGSGNMLIAEHPDGPVAIIEHGNFGGTCINRGMTPSKMLLRAADVAYGAAHAGTFGVGVTVTGVDWPAIGTGCSPRPTACPATAATTAAARTG